FLNGGSFDPIPNQSFIVNNPAGSGLVATNGTLETDLRLFRINGDPGLGSIFDGTAPFSIATQDPSLNDEIMFIGQGPTRDTWVPNWNASWQSVPPNSGPITHSGYTTIGDHTKRWGKNNVASNAVIGGSGSGVTADVKLKTGDGVTRDIISLATQF